MIKRMWNNLFLVERPSISLSAFRVCVAWTVGFVMLPTFCHLGDTYLSTAFKTYNTMFFPLEFVQFVQQSPDWLVKVFVGIFCISWLAFLFGLFSQVSCIIMTLACYYFYALNQFAMATLSWDILLVTVFLMCVTNYHSDYFSLDCLLRGREDAFRRKRPYFIQRLLQVQIGFTFFYTALHKITVKGNWLDGNPIYYLMNYPRPGVVKYFILKDYLMDKPGLCYAIGIFIVIAELLLMFALFYRKTRPAAIYVGCLFHVMLILTLDVPATFFFLFPPMLLLFINPEKIIQKIDRVRSNNQKIKPLRLIYDGRCQFCRKSAQLLKIMDLFGKLTYVDLHSLEDPKALHSGLTQEKLLKELHLLNSQGNVWAGFYAFRRLGLDLPMLYIFAPLMYLPGAGIIGTLLYKWIARNRYVLQIFFSRCHNESCKI